jgi:hypothetical protein
MYGYAFIQWKIAPARMQDANMQMTEQGQLTLLRLAISPNTTWIATEMVEAQLPAAPARGRTVISAHEHGRSAAERGRHSSRSI